ncbi:unnamed protein product [Dracunculus medinensis]|uniref:SCD domain-containing protein n=1 Tax=Dracunculus medinensis TaxID=318479 RepID=A0A0N4U128_DRAME|nr:unnamed protein product [Dracunculus medinensis]
MSEQGSQFRMVTRGVARIQYAESAGSSLSNASAGSLFSNQQISSTTDSRDDQSEYHMDVSMDSLFRTPSASTRGRKRRFTSDDPSDAPFLSKRGRPRGGGRGRGAICRRPNVQEDADESSLFCMVKSGKNLNTVTDNWIEEYEHHPDNALVQLQQFFISCCGCKGVISSVMLQTMEYSEIIRRMTEQFDEDSADYPLIMPGPQWKKFKQNFADFIMLLVNKCKASYVFDQRLMDSVIQLLTGLADSQVRAFRHTSTFAAMKLSSALVDIAIELVSLKEKNSKQVETEKAKLKAQSVNDRLDILILKKSELDEKTDDVRQMLSYIFKSVFVHRYRDFLSDIRSVCIHELGQWMQVYPQHFLEDSYLKYIGWSLYDKVSDVRLKCLISLLPLYDRPEVIGKLELFTNKFKDRLVSMVMDKDCEIATRACQLLTGIYRVFPTVLTLKDCVPIYELVYCNNRGLAQAAGEFLNTKVFQHSQRTRNGNISGSRSHENADLIIDLIQFFIEGDCHDHAAYLVDALIDSNPMMKDWATMADLLLSGEADRFDGELIEVLVCSVRQSATGEPPVGRSHQMRKTSVAVKEHRNINEDKTRLSEVLIPQLPLLLHRLLALTFQFIADREKVANLIGIALHFQLDMYLAARLEKHLDDLMSVMESIVEKHADDEILQSVARVMSYFTMNVAVAQHTETHRLKMLDGLALQLRHSVQRFHREQQLDEEDDAAMLASFRKITAFAIFEDLKKWQLWDPTLSVVTNSDDKQISPDIREKAILLLFSTLQWDLYRLIYDQETNKIEATKKLQKHRDHFVEACTNVLNIGASGVESAFLCFADALILFCGVHIHDEILEIHLHPSTITKITDFVVDNVFVESSENGFLRSFPQGGSFGAFEKALEEINGFLNRNYLYYIFYPLDRTMDQQSQIELMHKRRNLLAVYCKLILHGILEIYDASHVLRFYNKYYTDFGDILKMLINKCRELDKLGCAKTISISLYPIKNREALAVIHKEGILFALKSEGNRRGVRPENLSFLEVLIEFSGKLIRQDKQSILRYLEKHGTDVVNEEPYVLYKASLQERNDEVSSIRNYASRGRGRGRGRGRVTPVPSVFGDE